MSERDTLREDGRLAGASILVVDDETAARLTLDAILKRHGARVDTAADGAAAMEMLRGTSYDVVLLDLRMPGVDGTAVLRWQTRRGSDTQFIVLTAHGSLESAIVAVRAGAYDYLLKPCSVDQILATTESALEHLRSIRHQDQPIQLLERALASMREVPETALTQASGVINRREREWLRVDRRRGCAWGGERRLDLTPTELDLLEQLLQNRRVLSHAELVRAVRGLDLDERDARIYLRSHLRRLRLKIADACGGRYALQVVRGRGWIVEQLEVKSSESPRDREPQPE